MSLLQALLKLPRIALPRTHRPFLFATAGVVAAALALAGLQIAHAGHTAQGVPHSVVDGNPRCDTSSSVRIDPPSAGSFGNIQVTSIDGSSFAWQLLDTSVVVSKVIVKGGPKAEVYIYGAGFTGDSGLTAPDNPKSGTTYGLSHMDFCFEEEPPPPSTGSITIIKHTVGGDRTFDFTTTGSGLADFSLTTAGGTATTTITGLSAGAYSVTESVPPGWTLTGLSCIDPGATSTDGSTAFIDLKVDHDDDDDDGHEGGHDDDGHEGDDDHDAGETVTCTFTNTKDQQPETGTITIIKNAVGGDATFAFATTGAGLADFSLTTSGGTATKTVTGLTAGSYSVAEGTLAGWAFTTLSCTDPSGGTSTNGSAASIGLAAGETVTCTFTNTMDEDPGLTLTISKRVTTSGIGVAPAAGTKFTMQLTCSDRAGAVTLNLAHNESAQTTVEDGAVCSLVETVTRGATSVSNPLATAQTISATNRSFTVVNNFHADSPPGTVVVTIVKEVTTSGGGVAPGGASFAMTLLCGGSPSGFSLADGEQFRRVVVVGTVCSLDETDEQGATTVTGEFTNEQINVDRTFTVVNNYHSDAEPISLTITKVVFEDQPNVAPPAGTLFGFELTCSVSGVTNFSFADGQSVTLDAVDGETCTGVETNDRGASSVSTALTAPQVITTTNNSFLVFNNYVGTLTVDIEKTRTSNSPTPVGSTVVFDIVVTTNETIEAATLEDIYEHTFLGFVSASVADFELTCQVTANAPDPAHNTVSCELGDVFEGTTTITTTWKALKRTQNTTNVASILSDPDGPGGNAAIAIGPVSDDVAIFAVIRPPNSGSGGLITEGRASFGGGLLAAALAIALGVRAITRRDEGPAA